MSVVFLCAVGDIMIGRTFNDLLAPMSKSDLWGNTKNVFNTAHIVVGNLQTTLCDGNLTNKMQNKHGNHFYLEPELAGVLRDIPFDYLGLSSSHALDYGQSGLEQTLAALKTLEIQCSGAHTTRPNAREPAVFKMKLLTQTPTKISRIAIFSAVDHSEEIKADDNSSGIYYIDAHHPDSAIDFFRYYASRHPRTFIVLCYHWKHDGRRQQAQKLFEAGVDLILGVCPQSMITTEPYEIINGKYVIYNLGNFINDYRVDPDKRNDLGFIARVAINLQTRTIDGVEMYPTITHNRQVNLL